MGSAQHCTMGDVCSRNQLTPPGNLDLAWQDGNQSPEVSVFTLLVMRRNVMGLVYVLTASHRPNQKSFEDEKDPG